MTDRWEQPNAPACAPAAAAGPTGADAAGSAIGYEGVSFTYRAGEPFMEGLSTEVASGVVTSIIGPNGCGKSTLVKLALGLLRPAAGRVTVAGRDTAQLSPRERARVLAVLAQSSRIPPMTVESLVACGRHPRLGLAARLGPDDREAVQAAMERAGVARFAGHDVRQLSGGERQRAYLAMTLAQGTDLIVLDEPTTYLDINACHDLMALVRDLNRREGKTVAMVIHDLDLALRYSDRLIVMERGRVAGTGTAREVLAGGAIERAFSMDICPHDRPRPDGGAERGYVLYPRQECGPVAAGTRGGTAGPAEADALLR